MEQEEIVVLAHTYKHGESSITRTSKSSSSMHIQQQQQPPDAKEILVNATDNLREYKLPYGWSKKLFRRRSGVCENKWDTYLSSPTKDRFRSNRELETFLKAHPEVEYDPEVTKVQKPTTRDDPYFLALTGLTAKSDQNYLIANGIKPSNSITTPNQLQPYSKLGTFTRGQGSSTNENRGNTHSELKLKKRSIFKSAKSTFLTF